MSEIRKVNDHVTAESSPLEHYGDLIIQGNVEAGASVKAKGNITISGHIYNAKVTSLEGNITVNDAVKGSQAQVQALQGSITCLYIQNAALKAEKNIIVNGMIIDGHIISKSSVFVQTREGNIEGGQIEAGLDIVVHNLGSSNNNNTEVRISDFRQRELYNHLLNLESQIKILKSDRSQLDKYIQVIRILGKKVIHLPVAKKQELAEKVQQFQSLTLKIQELENIKARLFQPDEDKDELERSIIVRGQVFPGTRVFIDKARLEIQQVHKNIILYKRGIIIVGDYDQFMHRKKYS